MRHLQPWRPSSIRMCPGGGTNESGSRANRCVASLCQVSAGRAVKRPRRLAEAGVPENLSSHRGRLILARLLRGSWADPHMQSRPQILV